MKIKEIELRKVEIPMVGSFTTSFGTITKKPTVIVKLTTTDALVAYGEGAALPFPFYKPDTTDTTLLVLEKYVTPLILNKEFTDAQEFMNLLHSIKGHNFAKTAVENAVWMLLSLQTEKSIKQLLGGIQEKIGVGESIGIQKTLQATLDEVEERLEQGFQRIKIKIKPGWDVKVVDAMREKFGNIDLMVDGNSAYNLSHLHIFKDLDKYNLMMIEQPLADDDIIDHATLQKTITTPLCLDESVYSAEDARKAIEIGACKIINIKPGRVGGLLESKKIHDFCAQHGVGVWCGGMLETGIGRAYNISVASLPNYIYPADMSPVNFFYKDDLVEQSFVVDRQGFVKVSDDRALGIVVDLKKLKKYTIDKKVLK